MTNQITVATPTQIQSELEAKRHLCRTLLAGTFAMRAAGKKYLPSHPAESEGVYKTRLSKTFLDNFLQIAITKATGKILGKELIAENLPPEIESLCENIDRQGSGMDEFIRDVATTAFCDGISYVLVDMPPATGAVTRTDGKALGIRPYCIHIKPASIIEIKTEMEGGTETVISLRIMETVSIQTNNPWENATTQQVRVLSKENGKVVWQTYRQNERKEWILREEGGTSFKNIYLVPFYTNRTGFMQGEPGFQNIAESCLEHWQWKSEHAHALSMCCFGMYTATGVDPDFEFIVGPAQCQRSNQPDARFGILETTGTGVTLAAAALQAIESRMEQTGVNLRVENAGKVTATAAAIDAEDTNVGLKAVAESFGDSLETLYAYIAEIMGLQLAEPISVDLPCNFGVQIGTQPGLQELGKAATAGIISNESYLKELVRRGELSADFDIEENKAQLEVEQQADMGTITPIAPRNVPPTKKITRIQKNEDGTMSMIQEDQPATAA